MYFYNPVQVTLRSGVRESVIEECAGKRVLVVCTSSAFIRYKNDQALTKLLLQPSTLLEHDFASNPAISDIRKISRRYRDSNLDLIVGLGGGSAMDVAKIASVTIPASCEMLEIDDLLADEKLFSRLKPIDCLQVPTTAGTGSEVTPFATVWDYERRQKKSLSNPAMFAKKALIDPDFLCKTPLDVSISTGFDALNQAFESIWNRNADEYSRSISRRAAVLGLQALPFINNIAVDAEIRKKLATASLLAGLAISQTRTSICHSISYPLTLKYGIPHGLACAFSMLEVYKYNLGFIKDDIEQIQGALKQDPYNAIKDLFIQYDLKARLASALPSEAVFSESIEDFVAVGRFENNVRECDRSNLLQIIGSSYRSATN